MQSLSESEQYKLSEETIREIFPKIIERYITKENITPVKSPVAVILGGQPGAGKTGLQKMAQKQLNHNVVICNADDLREYHPNSEEIMEKYPEQYYDITTKYVQRWKTDLSVHCLNKNYNLINETTCSSKELIIQTIHNYKNHHFKVEIMLMAVDKEISRVSTMLRYEKDRVGTGQARMVTKAGHDYCFNNLLETIRLVEKGKLYDILRIYARIISIAGAGADNTGLIMLARNPDKVEQCLTQFYDREIPEQLKNFFKSEANQVLFLMLKRKAPAREIAQVLAEIKELENELEKKSIAQKRGRGLRM